MSAATPQVLIAGGGIAGMEALLALTDLAGSRAHITVLTPNPDLTMRPLIVEEPFSGQPAEAHALEPALSEIGADLVTGSLARVDPTARTATLADGSSLAYDHLVVCVGATPLPPFEGVVTFEGQGASLPLDELLASGEGRLAFVVPSLASWPLPVYELALMTERRKREAGLGDLTISLVTPETTPLGIFGAAASESVAGLLSGRGIELMPGRHVIQRPDGGLLITPGDEPLSASQVVTIPVTRGPALPGLPADEDGYIPVDRNGRVSGLDRVYAAGDCISYPVKQGGIGTQQADAAAEQIAAALGADVQPQPFTPVLRGMLFTGDESLSLRHTLNRPDGDDSVASSDRLWWPPLKVSGHYLSAWLARTTPHHDPEPPERGIEVEVALPHEWHGQPMALDPVDLRSMRDLER